jgi:hypothetical protein
MPAGKVPIALRDADTLVIHAARVWNECPDLRVAESKADTRRAARSFVARLEWIAMNGIGFGLTGLA